MRRKRYRSKSRKRRPRRFRRRVRRRTQRRGRRGRLPMSRMPRALIPETKRSYLIYTSGFLDIGTAYLNAAYAALSRTGNTNFGVVALSLNPDPGIGGAHGMGTGSSSVIGDKIFVKYIVLKCTILPAYLEGALETFDEYNHIREMLYWVPGSNMYPHAVAQSQSVHFIQKAERGYKKFYDKTYVTRLLGEASTAAGDAYIPKVITINHKIRVNKLFRRELQIYPGQAASWMWKPDLHWYLQSDSAVTPHPTFSNVHCAVYYTDA